jgi:hypothetical protein
MRNIKLYFTKKLKERKIKQVRKKSSAIYLEEREIVFTEEPDLTVD